MQMSPLDKVTQLRFDGYTVEMLALEIDLLWEGWGTSSMTNAVDALAAVAAALGNTDDTLRAELGKLGVEWRSEASSIAQGVMAASADFAEDATEKINEASQTAFGLSEAFHRALNTLPDSQTLRDGAEGLSTMDMLADLIGHETDHAAAVRAASAARDQAVDALNQLASSCGTELANIRQLGAPDAIRLDHAVPPPEQAGSAETGYQTMAAAAESVSDRPAPPPGGAPTAPVSAGPPPNAGAPHSGAPHSGANTTTGGRPPGGSGSGDGASGGGEPSGSGGDGGSGGSGDGGSGTGPVGGATDPLTGSTGDRAGYEPASVSDGTGAKSGGPPASTSGIQAMSGPAAPGTSPSGPGPSAAPTPGATALGPTALGATGSPSGVTADLLATGKLTGAAPQGHTQPVAASGHGTATAVPVADEDGIAGAATAIGAAGIAGAMSAEPDRERRAKAYGVTEDPAGTRHDFDVGAIEDEAEAETVAEIEPDARQDTPAYLEHAAPTDGKPEGRVRTHGIDDADLFADDRMVARDTIGEDPNNAYHDDRQDRP